MIRLGMCSKSDMLPCLQVMDKGASVGPPEVTTVILDGDAIVNMIKPKPSKTFEEHALVEFVPYILSQSM